MRLKNFKYIPFIVAFVVLVLDGYGVVLAQNHKDTGYQFDFDIRTTACYATSSGRRKDDDSYVYMNCTGGRAGYITGVLSYYATAHGGYSSNGSFYDCYYRKKHSTTYVLKYDTKSKIGQTGLLSNYINESGRTYARIYVSNKTPQASFSGVWSPDYKD